MPGDSGVPERSRDLEAAGASAPASGRRGGPGVQPPVLPAAMLTVLVEALKNAVKQDKQPDLLTEYNRRILEGIYRLAEKETER